MNRRPGNHQLIQKYLDRYGEEESRELHNFPDRTYPHALMIPAYRESTDFLQRLLDTGPIYKASTDKFLLILVSNHPASLSGASLKLVLEQHEHIKHWLDSPLWTSANLSLHQNEKFDTLLVDRTYPLGIPDNEGVGLARKIGADMAAALWLKGCLQSCWIMSSDADAHLPASYFDISPDKHASGLTYPFSHRITDDRVGQATALYEQSIHHYVNGLKKAGSSYAFQTVGSAQAINLFAYAKVRGYPKRAAAEDFYLLNKLAKVGSIIQLEKPCIELDSRVSDRAPFGTGPAVKQLLDSADMFAEPIFYHPQIFDHLTQLLRCFNVDAADLLEKHVQDLPETVRECLQEMGLENALKHARKQSLSGKTLQKHMRDWFDGFRTLRFVHLMRDRALANLSYKQWLIWISE